MEKKTWFIDIDGTLVEHRNNKELDEVLEILKGKYLPADNYTFSNIPIWKCPIGEFRELMLPDSKEFMNNIPRNDYIILTTARERRHSYQTEEFLRRNDIQWNQIIYDLPSGRRILINDSEEVYINEEQGTTELLVKAYGIPVERNRGVNENNVKSHLYWNNMGYKNLVGNSFLHKDAEHHKQQHDSMIQQEFEWEW